MAGRGLKEKAIKVHKVWPCIDCGITIKRTDRCKPCKYEHTVRLNNEWQRINRAKSTTEHKPGL